FPLSRQFGIDRGFDHFDDRLTAGVGAWLERPAAATVAAAAAWAESARSPWFLWVHLYEPHFPYEPPARLRRPGPRGAYDGEAALADEAVGDLLQRLDARGVRGGRPRLTLFAADHGESLGEHGEGTHGFFVYDSTLLVPVVVAWPGRIAAAASGAAVRLVDLAPTVLDLLGLPAWDGVDGVSLAPLLAGRAQEPPPAYVETWQPWTSYGWSPLKGVRHGGWKLIAAPRPELYDLRADPGETRNVLDAAAARTQARQLRAALRAAEERPAAKAAAIPSDPEAAARLRALGYAGAGGPAGAPPPGLPDPKDRAHLRELLTEADELLRAGRPAEALARFEEVLRQEPANRFAAVRSGLALFAAGDLGRAIPRLERAAALDPAGPETRAALAEALDRAGRPADAVPHWRELARLQPRRAFAWSNLGAALGRSDRIEEAVAALRTAAELEPGNPDRQIRLGFAELAAGRPAAAAAHLERAAAVLGPERFPHPGALGVLLAQSGRPADARPWLLRSRPEEPDHAESRLALARLELEAGNRPAAAQALREALAAAPHLKTQVERDPALRALLP
ncbi:MAG TPA: sulfatase-like hydrolase/transferase, partial [Thermoanaerobaculia bacterium]|nr:sulfatase-like hydrolase/transferase [Thermoanaerobaculia bacterium]